MFRDRRVHAEAALARRQAVIAPMSGEHGDQLAIAGEARQRFCGRAPRVAQEPAAQQRPRQAGQRRGNRLFGEEQLHGARRVPHLRGVAADGVALPRKVLAQALRKTIRAAHKIIGTVRDADAVVDFRHGVP